MPLAPPVVKTLAAPDPRPHLRATFPAGDRAVNTRRQFLIRAPLGLLAAAAACNNQQQNAAGSPPPPPGAPPTFG
ncbi:MAG TPA: hypothetical protein VHE78_17060, partial [Gemmatimonadaceae bacterium]|nr:hypothetical protein [Gemmatimonadaceae bacterium]